MASDDSMIDVEYSALSEAKVNIEPGYSEPSSSVQPQTPRSEKVLPQEAFESQFQVTVPPFQPYIYEMGSIRQQQQRDDLTQQEISRRQQQDYQMQLMLLEHQNKKRLMMARQESLANRPFEQAPSQDQHNMNPVPPIPSVDPGEQDSCHIGKDLKTQEPREPQLWIDWEVQAKSHLGLAPNATPSHTEQVMLDHMVRQKYDQVWGYQEKQENVKKEAAPTVIKTYQEQLRAQALLKQQQAHQLWSQDLAKQAADRSPNDSASRQACEFTLNLRNEQDRKRLAGVVQTEQPPTQEIDLQEYQRQLMRLDQERKKFMVARQTPPANGSERRGKKRAMVAPMGQPQQCSRPKLDETSRKTTAKEAAPQCCNNPVQAQNPGSYEPMTAAEALAHRQALPTHALQDYQLQLMLLEQQSKKRMLSSLAPQTKSQGKEIKSSSLEGTREGAVKNSQGLSHPQQIGSSPFDRPFNQTPSGEGQAAHQNSFTSALPVHTTKIIRQRTNPTCGCTTCPACRPNHSLGAYAQELQRVQQSQPSNSTKSAVVIDLTKEDGPAPKQRINESPEIIRIEDVEMLNTGDWQYDIQAPDAIGMHGQDASSTDSEWSRLSTPEGTPEVDGFLFVERHGPLAIRPAPERAS